MKVKEERDIRTHPKKVPFEYNQIDKNIFIGTNMCCKSHFEKDLTKKGIKADLSMEGERVDQPYGVEYYLWLPTKNHHAPTQKQLAMGVAAMKHWIKNNVKIYVHCQRGHGRAPTMVAAYYISKGLTPKQAFEKIKKKRPVIHFTNVQWSALRRFAKK